MSVTNEEKLIELKAEYTELVDTVTSLRQRLSETESQGLRVEGAISVLMELSQDSGAEE